MGRDHLERHGRIDEHLRPIEDDGAREGGVVAGTTPEQLILRLGGKHQLVDQVRRVAAQRVRHDKGRPMQRRLVHASERRGDLVGGLLRRRVEVASYADGEAYLLAPQSQRACGSLPVHRVGELARRGRTDDQGARALGRQRFEQGCVVVGRCGEDDDRVRCPGQIIYDLSPEHRTGGGSVRQVAESRRLFHVIVQGSEPSAECLDHFPRGMPRVGRVVDP